MIPSWFRLYRAYPTRAENAQTRSNSYFSRILRVGENTRMGAGLQYAAWFARLWLHFILECIQRGPQLLPNPEPSTTTTVRIPSDLPKPSQGSPCFMGYVGFWVTLSPQIMGQKIVEHEMETDIIQGLAYSPIVFPNRSPWPVGLWEDICFGYCRWNIGCSSYAANFRLRTRCASEASLHVRTMPCSHHQHNLKKADCWVAAKEFLSS